MKKQVNYQEKSELDDYGSMYFYKFADIVAEKIHKIPYMSPNIITTIRNVLLLNICYKVFYKQDFDNLAIYVFLIAILDCLDGEYARKYNMISKFGDNYDHLSDFVTNLVLLFIIYKYSDTKYNIIIALLFLFTASQQMICSERYRKKYMNLETSRDSLNIFNPICKFKTKSGLENFLEKYRFLGYGTYYMVLTILISKIKK